jgi:hypothetical protein
MAKAQDILVALALAGGAALTPTGCEGTVRYAVNEPPPSPVSEPVLAPHGQEWIPGHWANVDNRWTWHGGHFEDQRPGYLYEPGSWRYSEGRYVWVEGGWRASTRGVVQR